MIASAVNLYLGAVRGDLTRLGWLPERDFRPTQPTSTPVGANYNVGRYDTYYDVVVIGDSFSGFSQELANIPHERQWQSWLAGRTQLSILTVDEHIDDFSFETFISSSQYKRVPPRLVIVEVTERYLVFEFGRRPAAQCIGVRRSPSPPLPITLHEIQTKTHEAHRLFDDIGELNPGYVRAFLVKNALKVAGYPSATKVVAIPLTTPALFSNRKGDVLLVYIDELAKRGWSSEDLARVRCYIAWLKQRIESNGGTRLLVMIVPDKLSIYSDYAVDQQYRTLSRLDEVLDADPATYLRLDKTLGAAVRDGLRDVWLPNDTHWGPLGHKLVAQSIIEFLQEPGVGVDQHEMLGRTATRGGTTVGPLLRPDGVR